MTIEDEIVSLRLNCYGYKKIANQLGIKRDKVRQICIKNNLAGFRAEKKKLQEKICKNCGKPSGKYVICQSCKEQIKNEKSSEIPKIRIVKCEVCKKEFRPRNNKHRFCSRQCNEKWHYQNKRPIEIKECEFCGSAFSTRITEQKYCSKKCCRMANRQGRRERRLTKDEIVDADISLYSVAKKDKHICWICHKKVDWTDYDIADTGKIIHNNMYPSIDHVIPITKGGEHEWNNVRLAHRICNTKKSNRTTFEEDNGQLTMYL